MGFFSLVGPDGVVCISILHEPGDDKYGYETASERWLPVHTVETILVSVISMISDPNDESPANVDAAVSTFDICNNVFTCSSSKPKIVSYFDKRLFVVIVDGINIFNPFSRTTHPISIFLFKK